MNGSESMGLLEPQTTDLSAMLLRLRQSSQIIEQPVDFVLQSLRVYLVEFRMLLFQFRKTILQLITIRFFLLVEPF